MEQNFFFEYASSFKVHLSGTDKNLAQLESFFYLIIVWPWGVKSAPCPLCNSTYHVIGYLIICVHAVYTMIRSLASFVLPEHHCDLENPHPIGNNIPIWKSNNNLHNFKIAHTHKYKINVPRLLKKSCPPLSQRGKKSRKFLLAPQHLNSFFSHSLESQNNFWQQVGVLCDKGCVRLLRWVLASLNQQVIQSCEFLLPTSDQPNSASTSSQLNDIVLVLFSRGSVYKGFAGTWHGGCWVTVCPML